MFQKFVMGFVIVQNSILVCLGQPVANDNIVVRSNYDFVLPLDVPIFLSGNFGEPRSTHFHTGIDIRTKGQEQLNVFSIDDGYVSRIGVSSKGYGKVIYVTHPKDNITSVYAHLHHFEGEIESYTKKLQYSQHLFEMDIMVPKGVLNVTKGQVIAYSGNTGGSGGPHLHFEIRNAKTEETLNPQMFGFVTKDDFAPMVTALKFYDMSSNRMQGINKIIALKKINGILTTPTPVVVNSPSIGIGLNGMDKSFNSIGRNGIFNIELKQNDKTVFESKMDKIHFDDWRFSYAYTDYDERTARDAIFYKCYVDPCNEARIYTQYENNGIIELKEGEPSIVHISARDFLGNHTEIEFKVIYQKESTFFGSRKIPMDHIFYCNRENTYENDKLQVVVPQGCLADDIPFTYKMAPSKTLNSDVHYIHSRTDALLDSIYISIVPTYLPRALQKKALIGYYEGTAIKSAGGEYKGDVVETWFNKFGTYFITTDVTPPKILSTNMIHGRKFNGNVFSFRAIDNLSGIYKYNAYIDDQWVLLEYDLKAHHFFHRIEGIIEPGLHTFRVNFEDYKGNESVYTYDFIK